MSSVYFGGSRSLAPSPLVAQVVQAVLLSGQSIHVGCQSGADQQVINYASGCYSGQFVSSLVIFAVAPFSSAPAHVLDQDLSGALVHYSAGGTSAPIKARYLLRSIAAFQGCSQAVFFSPGSGSLAVARECVKSGIPVFAFSEQEPNPISSQAGRWVFNFLVIGSQAFPCWSWSSAQLSLL